MIKINQSVMPKQNYQSHKSGSHKLGIFLPWSFANSVPLAELAVFLTLVIGFYLIASTLDLSEKWVDWAEEYEHLEIDELPLGLGFASLNLAWFSWRRWLELKKINSKLSHAQKLLLVEIEQRKRAESDQADVRLQLEKSIAFQQQRAERIRAVQEMGNLLIFAHERAEIFTIAVRYANRIIPFSSGAIYACGNNSLEHVRGWGILAKDTLTIPDGYTCWAMRQGKLYTETFAFPEQSLCPRTKDCRRTLCVPILTPKGVWGILYFRQDHTAPPFEHISDLEYAELENLAKTIADNIGLHLHSLSLKEQLTLESINDPLTGIFNRRGLLKSVEEGKLLQNSQIPFSILIFDIDNFKSFNDNFGHSVGDTALVSVVKRVNGLIRREDIFCRYGGEEFLLILKETGKASAMIRAESIRNSIEQQILHLGSRHFDDLTISIGVATFPEDASNYDALIKHADAALYKAKSLGRNRVIGYTQ